MTTEEWIPAAKTDGRGDPRITLFSAGERWGWEFRDRRTLYRPFQQQLRPLMLLPAPDATAVQRSFGKRNRFRLLVCVGIIVGVFLLNSATSQTPIGPVLRGLLGLIASGAFLYGIFLLFARSFRQRRAMNRAHQQWHTDNEALRQAHQGEQQQLHQAKLAYDRAEWGRLNTLPQWGAIRTPAGTRRVYVYGGTSYGWIALTTTYAASCLGSGQRVTVLDFSESAVSRVLDDLAGFNNISRDNVVLPRDLAAFDGLAGLSAEELKDVLTEALHSNDTDAAARDMRALNDQTLSEVFNILGSRLSMPRIFAALRAIIRQEPQPLAEGGVLSFDEWNACQDLYSDEVRRDNLPRINALQGKFSQLRTLGTQVAATRLADPRLRCITLSAQGSTLLNSLLMDLLFQLAIRSFRSGGSLAAGIDVFIVAGADGLPRRLLKKLSDLSEQQGVRLVFMFKQLRDDAADILGTDGAATIFMRLGNAQEAEHAAQQIGKSYKFRLTQLTKSVSDTITNTYGESIGVSETVNFFPQAGRSEQVSLGISKSVAEAATKQTGDTIGEVYTYDVEPRILQLLPQTAILMPQPGGLPPKLGECLPSLLQRDDISLDPLVLERPAPVFDRPGWR